MAFQIYRLNLHTSNVALEIKALFKNWYVIFQMFLLLNVPDLQVHGRKIETNTILNTDNDRSIMEASYITSSSPFIINYMQ